MIKQNVLVTGATGFVGTWLTKKLLDLGHNVHVLARQESPNWPFAPDQIKIVRGDVCNANSLIAAFKNIDTVFHLAGVVGYSRAMRETMYQTNVLGTKNVIAAFEHNQCKKLVYMSSVVAVGASFDGHTPLNEQSAYNLRHLNLGYFETKREAEELVLTAVRERQLPAVILNPSTIYGPGDAKKGSRTTQIKVAQGRFPFYTGGGVNVIHIDDVLHGICRAWEVGQIGERYILSGENIQIKNLFEIIASISGVQPPKIFLPKPVILMLGKLGDTLEAIGKKGPINSENAWAAVLFHWFDNSKAKSELGLNPRPAEDAIKESVLWMRDNGLLKK